MNTWHGSNICHHETMVFQEWGESIKIIKICRDCRDEEGSASDNDNHVNLIGGPTTCAHLSAPTVTSRLNWQRGPIILWYCRHHCRHGRSSSRSLATLPIITFTATLHCGASVLVWCLQWYRVIFSNWAPLKMSLDWNEQSSRRDHHESCPPHEEKSQGLLSKPWWWRQKSLSIVSYLRTGRRLLEFYLSKLFTLGLERNES